MSDGVAVLRGVVSQEWLVRVRSAAERCFDSVGSAPERWRFNRFSHSVLLNALLDLGITAEELLAPLSSVEPLFSEAMGESWACRIDQAWLRKKFAPGQIADTQYRPHTWHQDGALGVRFPVDKGPEIPMNPLMTCWIPLTACGVDSPGLEFVRCRLSELLHFTELDDEALRRRFPAEAFWAPALEAGDCVVFPGGTLHRTYTSPEMRQNRLSVEYRIFPS